MTPQEFLTVAGWIAEGNAQIQDTRNIAWVEAVSVNLHGQFYNYRHKPEPREFWIVDADNAKGPRVYPVRQFMGFPATPCPNQIHVREVIEP